MRKLLSFIFILGSLYSYSQSMCGGSSATITPTSTLTPPVSYTLVTPTGTFAPAGGVFVVSPSVTTTYTLVANSGTTTNATPLTVTVNPQPMVAPTFTQATCTSSNNCFNLNLTFSPASPVPGYTIAWSGIPNGILTSTQYSTCGYVTAGPYTATITAVGGCSLITNFTIDPQPAPANFTVTPFGTTHSITCLTPTVTLVASNPYLTYTWTSTSFSPIISSSVSLDATQLGTITLCGQNTLTGCSACYTYALVQNTSTPTSTISASGNPTLITITCTQTSAPTLTIVASPSVNINNVITDPVGGIFSASSYSTIYQPGVKGVYTITTVNTENGCFTNKTFTVTSNDNYPTYTVSSPQNFTLGCKSTSFAVININNAQTTPTPGGAVSYTLLPPSYTLTYGTGTISSYTVTTPGTWTVIVKDNANFCETRNVVSVLQLTFAPQLSVSVPLQVLDCTNSVTILQGTSETSNVSYNWGFTGTPGNIVSPTITVHTNTTDPTKITIDNYTLTITDNVNKCTSFSVVPMSQNIFPPKVLISNGGTASLSCKTQSIVLTNQSSTGIPPAAPFPTNNVVGGYIWYGPTPQEPLQLSTTYTAQVVGIYTLVAKDYNNGCLAVGTLSIGDNISYPTITTTNAAEPTPVRIIDCGTSSVVLTPTYNPTGLTYSWTAPTTTSSIGSSTLASFTVKYPGTYTVLATNPANGCASQATMATVNGTLIAKISSNVDSGYVPLPVIFYNQSSSKDTSKIATYWNFSNGKSDTTNYAGINPTTTYYAPGNYKVTAYTIKGSCIDTAYRTIKVFSASSLTVPNIFTPNGDGVNDLYFLKATNLSEVNMVIYDRWGHLTFEIISKTGNIEWDGKNQYGKECADGVYYYRLKAKGHDGESYEEKGTINLVR